MICVFVVAKYPKYKGIMGLLSMALFGFSFFANKRVSFYKLMGCGKNGGFSIKPDFNQWALLYVVENINETALPKFIARYFLLCNCRTTTLILKPLSAHGSWDGKKCFGNLPPNMPENIAPLAVLTRATIRLSRLKQFWKNVPSVNNKIATANGLQQSFGVGEMPFIKQATLSVWQDTAAMKEFAYKTTEHTKVISNTRKQNWYKEEMFARFEVVEIIEKAT